MTQDVDLSGIVDPEARRIIALLLNTVETLTAEVSALRADNQRLRDENNRFKGEQGAPTLRPSTRPTAQDHSSQKERGRPAPARPAVDKRAMLQIDRTVEREMDPGVLPADAVRKGDATDTVQDVVLRTQTACLRCARGDAARTGRSYQAPLPAGDAGHDGPRLTALALHLY